MNFASNVEVDTNGSFTNITFFLHHLALIVGDNEQILIPSYYTIINVLKVVIKCNSILAEVIYRGRQEWEGYVHFNTGH